jgi:hypothetical protein
MKKILIGMAGFLLLMGGLTVGDGTAQTTYTISGSVIRTFDNAPVSGVTMTGFPGNPTTDANGYYLGTVPTNWSGTVKPEKIGYAIHPASQIYSNVASDLTMNFGATLLPKAAVVPVVPDKTTYYPGEPISITMTIENQGGDIITSKGFKEKNFHLTLWFTDPDGKLITTNVETGFTPPPPSVTPIVIDNKVQLLPIEYVETVPASWVLSTIFNALDYYTLTKSGNYSVKARFDMSDYLEIYETAPGSGIFYAPLESASSGYVESNIVSFTLLAKANQTITVTQAPPANAIYNTSFTVGATASSGLTVSIGASGACSINGNTITMTSGTGTCSITFDQAGDATYNAAPQVTRSVTAQKASQTITFNPLPNKTYGDPPFTVGASASSGLQVSFNIVSGPATISGNIVTITGLGTVTVRASQAGNSNYNPSPSVDRSFQVSYIYTGFFSPVENLPVFNVVKAGQAIPVKFSLHGNQGLDIFATGHPTSVKIECSATGLYDAIEETVTAGGSSLSYDPASDRYTYVWKTDKAWSNTCRQFVVKFKDGSYQRANFQFKK